MGKAAVASTSKGSQAIVFVCNICRTTFQTRKGYDSHCTKKHLQLEFNDEDDDPSGESVDEKEDGDDVVELSEDEPLDTSKPPSAENSSSNESEEEEPIKQPSVKETDKNIKNKSSTTTTTSYSSNAIQKSQAPGKSRTKDLSENVVLQKNPKIQVHISSSEVNEYKPSKKSAIKRKIPQSYQEHSSTTSSDVDKSPNCSPMKNIVTPADLNFSLPKAFSKQVVKNKAKKISDSSTSSKSDVEDNIEKTTFPKSPPNNFKDTKKSYSIRSITPTKETVPKTGKKIIPTPTIETSKAIIFDCPVENCSMSFDKPSIYRNHLEIHEGLKPFVCPHCKFGYDSEIKVMEHVATKHAVDATYECEKCGRKYIKLKFFKAHRIKCRVKKH